MKSEPGSDLNLIAAGTVFEGKIRTQGSIRIDGKIVGEIAASQNVSIGTAGDIEGNITAKNITIGGKVKGMVQAAEKMVFESKSVIRGDIRAAKLVIDDGAVFDGKCIMTSEVRPQVPAPDPRPDFRRPEERR